MLLECRVTFVPGPEHRLRRASGRFDPVHGNAGQTVQVKRRAPGRQRWPGQRSRIRLSDHRLRRQRTRGGSGGLIERTTDGANSWTQVGSSSNGLNAIVFVTPTTAFAVGDHNTLLESTDSGNTWQPQPLALPAGAGPFNLEHISCSSVTTCVMTTADGKELIRTADGGRPARSSAPPARCSKTWRSRRAATWSASVRMAPPCYRATPDRPSRRLVSGRLPFTWSVFGPGLRAGGLSGHAYANATHGRIAATTDGGASWNLLRVPTVEPDRRRRLPHGEHRVCAGRCRLSAQDQRRRDQLAGAEHRRGGSGSGRGPGRRTRSCWSEARWRGPLHATAAETSAPCARKVVISTQAQADVSVVQGRAESVPDDPRGGAGVAEPADRVHHLRQDMAVHSLPARSPIARRRELRERNDRLRPAEG